MRDPIFIATYDSRHYTFQGVGTSEAQAIDICAQGLRCHAKQCGISETWWWDDFSPKNEAEAMSPDYGLISVRAFSIGEAYRDGSVLKAETWPQRRERTGQPDQWATSDGQLWNDKGNADYHEQHYRGGTA